MCLQKKGQSLGPKKLALPGQLIYPGGMKLEPAPGVQSLQRVRCKLGSLVVHPKGSCTATERL